MKNIPFDSYDKIFEALIAFGYSEPEAEELICDVIEDQKNLDNISERLRSIYADYIKNTNRFS